MKTKQTLISILILVGLFAAAIGAYTVSRFYLRPSAINAPALPPFSQIDLPSQTQNGYTATVESYYADASRILFRVRVNGGDGFVSGVNLYDKNGSVVNASTGFGPAGNPDLSLNQIEFDTTVPLPGKRFMGQLAFSYLASPVEGETLAQFQFDIDIPIKPAKTYGVSQEIDTDAQVRIHLDRIVVTPASTQAYLCYTKPSEEDWMIGSESTLIVDGRSVGMYYYELLYDATMTDGVKGGERGWIPVEGYPRCVKVGFPIGSDLHQDSTFTLTISSLERSMPEVIPPDEVKAAIQKLKERGIEMTYESLPHGNTWEFTKLPPGMDQRQAYLQFTDALGYTHKGPWVFHVQLEGREDPQPVFTTSYKDEPAPIAFPTTKPRVVAELPGRIRSFDVSPDSKSIAFATSEGVVFYDLESYKHLRTLEEKGDFYLAKWSPNGDKLATVRLDDKGASHLIVWDANTWQTIFEQKSQDREFDSIYGDIAWSPDEKLLADSVMGMVVTVRNAETGEVVSQQESLYSYGISWSPDGSRLVATGDWANGIRRWKVSTNEAILMLDQRTAGSLNIAWSPDGERIASGQADGRVCFWTAATNQCDGLIRAHANAVFSLAWSSDGAQLATGGGILRIWDTNDGMSVISFGKQTDIIYTELKWPAGQPLISLESGNANEAPTIVRFWDAETGNILFEFRGAKGRQ